MDVWNFSLGGTRSSIGAVNAYEGQARPHEVDLELLTRLPSEWPPMVLSGFLLTVWKGAIVRNGLRLGQGVDPYPTRWATPEEAEQALRAADRELALEAARRRHVQSAPSRLSCLWLADNTIRGRNWVESMLGPKSFLFEVRVLQCSSLARCDARWLDRVYRDPADSEATVGYWSGEARDEDPLWESLLEGQIASSNPAELSRLREFVRRFGPPKDLMGPPQKQDS